MPDLMPILALDPGLSGGAALLSGRAVVAWWAWSTRRAGVWCAPSVGDGVLLPSLAAVAAFVAAGIPPGALLVVEAQHVRRGIPQASALACAYHAGLMAGPLELAGCVPGPRPHAGEWARLCGGAGLPGKRMTLTAITWARLHLDWSVPCTRPLVPSDDCLGAIHEAAVMACWADGLANARMPP